MAKKQIAAIVKIQIPAGQASPAPPLGTALAELLRPAPSNVRRQAILFSSPRGRCGT